MNIEATGPGSIPEITSLLKEGFGVSETPNFEPALLRWKYYDPGPAWTGSRSYALRKSDALVAHVCTWPFRIATTRGSVKAVQMLDWVSARNSPGAGVAIARKLEAMADVLITCGGSLDTQKILPRIGFVQRAPFKIYARVLRPWLQFRSRPSEGPKAAARLVRNTIWSRLRLADRGEWSARRQPLPDAELLARLEAEPVSGAESRYCPEFLEFMLRCPGASVEYFSLYQKNNPEGFFLLARVGGQTRLADLRILSRQPSDWSAAYATAVSAALEDPEACELVARAYVPLVAGALEANGFRLRGSGPVFVRDPRGLLAGTDAIHLSMLDDDSAFLRFPESPYIT